MKGLRGTESPVAGFWTNDQLGKWIAHSVIILVMKLLCSVGLTVLGLILFGISSLKALESAL